MTTERAINDGGPAFPVPAMPSPERSGEHWEITYKYPGMSLRDWLAGQALPAIIALDNGPTLEADAATAYRYADALLAEREKRSAT